MKGHLVFWEFSEINTTKEKLEELGFGDFVPRNDFKSALIKALKTYTKGNEKMYRRFADAGDSVKFSVFVQDVSTDDLELRREVTLRLDKTLGTLTGGPDSLKELYNNEKKTINSQQLRAMILRYMRKKCRAISMRSGGGIYFIDEKFLDELKGVKKLFSEVEGSKLYQVPVYNDEGTLDAIQDAACADIFGDIESLIAEVTKEFNEGKITRRRLETRLIEAEEIINKIKDHGANLRSKAVEVAEKANHLHLALGKAQIKIEDGLTAQEEFIECLVGL